VPEDGWLTVVLLAVLVFITVLSIQSVTPPWAPGLQTLTLTTGAGMLLGYLVVEQGFLPGFIAHPLALALGVAYAIDQTAHTVLDTDRLALIQRTLTWFRLALLSSQSSSDNAVFLLFLSILTLLLAYISFWLVLRTRRPWLAVLANGTVLLINLNWASDALLYFLVLFLLAAMLLLVRFTLAENMRHWRARGLRFSTDLSWDFTQAGVVFAVIVLLLAYVLPIGVANGQVAAYLNDPKGPWVQFQQRVGRVFGGVVGPKGIGGGVAFGTTVHLVGSVDLPDTQVLHYTTADDSSQYLATQSFDTYDGKSTWTQSQTEAQQYDAQQTLPPSSPTIKVVKPVGYTITFDAVDGNGQQGLLTPGSEPEAFNVPSVVYFSTTGHAPAYWQAQQPIALGGSVLARAYVSTATENDLRAVPPPTQVTNAQPDAPYYYPPGILQEYEVNPVPISAEVSQTAADQTKGMTNMYDAAVAIEDYLRTFTYSTHNPDPPQGQDAIVWFLHQKQGYCTFFASAMALMARSLGMPARIVSGFINGSYDNGSNSYVVKGTAAHVWTQIYFAKYGWINFEPTQTYGKFGRTSNIPVPVASQGTTQPGQNQTPSTGRPREDIGDTGTGSSPAATAAARTGLVLSIVLLLLLVLLAAALIWWRLLFRGLPPTAAFFGRLTRLGAWAGAPPDRTQTPGEYAERLGEIVPAQRTALQRLSVMYSRERYGATAKGAHGAGVPGTVTRDARSLYDSIRAALARVISRRIVGAPLDFVRRGRRPRASGDG
jgi:hypothetical protein